MRADEVEKRCVMSLVCPQAKTCVPATWHTGCSIIVGFCLTKGVPKLMQENSMCVARGEEIQP